MISRRVMIGLMGGIALLPGLALAQDAPAPFDNPGEVKIALVRYLDRGFFPGLSVRRGKTGRGAWRRPAGL